MSMTEIPRTVLTNRNTKLIDNVLGLLIELMGISQTHKIGVDIMIHFKPNEGLTAVKEEVMTNTSKYQNDR